MKTAVRKRVLFPFLALLFTIAVFALVLFCDFLNISPFVRLMQGTTPFYSLPLWFRYCLLHPALFKALFRLGFGFSVLGSMFTLFLLLKTEPPPAASEYLARIGRGVLFSVGGIMTLLLPLAGMIEYKAHFTHHHFGSWNSIRVFLVSLLVDLVPGTLVLTALIFSFLVVMSAFVKIIGRLRASAPARQSPHVLQ